MEIDTRAQEANEQDRTWPERVTRSSSDPRQTPRAKLVELRQDPRISGDEKPHSHACRRNGVRHNDDRDTGS